MEVTLWTLEGVRHPAWIIRVRGDVDISATPCLVDALRTARREGDGLVVLDLREARHVASGGIHALLSAKRRLASAGRRLVIACDAQTTMMTLPVAGLAEVLEMFPGVDAALASERARSDR